jgi:hypothetical protein
MLKTRDNHYVPQWHQKGFMINGRNNLRHLKKRTIDLPNGDTKIVHSKNWFKPAQCFYQTDLYTTFFGTEINDEIERKLFSQIDDNGSESVKAYLTDDQSNWHTHFQDFFEYLDSQKIRTPKGLDWLKSKYSSLDQNKLMLEMQSIRMMNCTLWTEGVRELVSANNSDVKFIISDHPVTVYNYACPPDSEHCQYPNDPDIALKGTQTIFPLDQNRCLILTNLEYAKDPIDANPLEQRTNAIRVRPSLVKTIEFINTRELTAEEVTSINYIIKSRAKDSIAAGSEEWLFPEKSVSNDWSELRHVLMPPSDQLHRYGGEMYVGHEDGSTYYQDAFGRTTPQHEFLCKDIDEKSLGRNDRCGCGSGRKYKHCCRDIPEHHRTTWSVYSVRERNLTLCNAIRSILGLDKGKTWNDVRRQITPEQVSEIYQFYAYSWPKETDIYSLLPKPDGRFRAIYTGPVDVRTISAHALGIAPHFDEFLILNPMVNANNVNPEFSPVESPNQYMYQALKDILFILSLEPLIANNLVNIIPDPGNFDLFLQREMMGMATKRRNSSSVSQRDRELFFHLATEDLLNSTHMMPHDVKKRMLVHELGIPEELADEALNSLRTAANSSPLMLLQPIPAGEGQLMISSMSPNYEMSLFIAQVTGSVIVTDSETRWKEFEAAQHRKQNVASHPWSNVHTPLETISLDYEAVAQWKKSSRREYVNFRAFLKAAHTLVEDEDLNTDYINRLIKKSTELARSFSNLPSEDMAPFQALSPLGGFYDSNVQRLLLKSNCSNYLDKVRSVYRVGF